MFSLVVAVAIYFLLSLGKNLYKVEVLDARARLPVEGAIVYFFDGMMVSGYSATNAKGVATFKGSSSSFYVFKEGFEEAIGTLSAKSAKAYLEKPSGLAGHERSIDVVDSEGRPIAGALVELLVAAMNGDSQFSVNKLAAKNGTAFLGRLGKEEAGIYAAASAEGYYPKAETSYGKIVELLKRSEVEGKTGGVEIAFFEAKTFGGETLLVDGEVGNITAFLVGPRTSVRGEEISRNRVNFSQVPEDTYRLYIESPTFKLVESRAQVNVSAGITRTSAFLVERNAVDPLQIVAIDPSGKAIENAQIEVYDPCNPPFLGFMRETYGTGYAGFASVFITVFGRNVTAVAEPSGNGGVAIKKTSIPTAVPNRTFLSGKVVYASALGYSGTSRAFGANESFPDDVLTLSLGRIDGKSNKSIVRVRVLAGSLSEKYLGNFRVNIYEPALAGGIRGSGIESKEGVYGVATFESLEGGREYVAEAMVPGSSPVQVVFWLPSATELELPVCVLREEKP